MSVQNRAERRRLVKALLIAPLATPLCVVIWSAVTGFRDLNRGLFESAASLVSILVLFGLPAELIAATLGFPVYLAYRRFQISSWISYAIGGALISQIPMIIFAYTGTLYFLTGQPAVTRGLRQALPLALLCGASSGLFFRWLVARREA
jgi:uncharacterized membrane protein